MPSTSDQGKIPGAPATSPGGMSQQALVDELLTKHGWEEGGVADWRRGKGWDLKAWNDMIDFVIQARRDRERESKSAVVAEEMAEILLPSSLDQMESELAEMREAYEQAKAEQRALSLLKIDLDTNDYIFDGHAGAGPSASHRWMTCTASLKASRKFLETLSPNQQREYAKSNIAARQGTTAHRVGEVEAHVVRGEMTRAEADAELMELAIMPEDGVEYDDEMAEYVSEYTALVASYVHDRGAENVGIEERVSAVVPLTGVHEDEVYEIPGSADCTVLPTPEHPDLVVADLKYGSGIDVDVDSNPQIRIYALGLLNKLTDEAGNLTVDVSDITYHIAQPRLGGLKTWTETLDDLLDWRDDVLSPLLTEALYGPATFTPEDEACQFCPARGSCAALADHQMEKAADLFDAIAEAEFDGEEFPETVPLLDDARLGELLSQIKGLVKVYESLKDEAQRRLYRGQQVPGWQLVNYSPPRTWDGDAAEILNPDYFDEDEFDAATVMMLWKRVMLSPTQALAALKKAGVEDTGKIADLIVHPEKRPVIAPEGDRRSKWEGRAPEDMFDIEEG